MPEKTTAECAAKNSNKRNERVNGKNSVGQIEMQINEQLSSCGDCCKKLFDLVDQAGDIGVSEEELKERLDVYGFDAETVKRDLRVLVQSADIIICGIDKRRYVSARNGNLWLVRTRDGQGFVPRPWVFPSGRVNWKILKWMLEGVFSVVFNRSGLTVQELVSHFSAVMQPALTVEVVQILSELGCLSFCEKTLAETHKLNPFLRFGKAQTSLINTIGFLDGDVYYPEPDCFQNVRDLIRCLHRDGRELTVRRLCMEHNIVKNDLVPILKSETSEELFDAALRICVILCQPTLLAFGGKLPEEDDFNGWQIFYELETSLLHQTIFRQGLGGQNIGVESSKYSSVPEVDYYDREKVIQSFFSSGLDAVFLKLSNNSTELVELNEAKCEGDDDLARNKLEENVHFERDETAKIELVKHEESNKRLANRRNFLLGTFALKGVKAFNSENDFVLRGALASKENESSLTAAHLKTISQRKRPKKMPRTRRVNDFEGRLSEKQTANMQQLAPEAMLSLKGFCWRLLTEDRYNKLMRMTREIAFIGSDRHHSRNKLNELHFLNLATFAIAFARHSHISCQNVSATFSVEFFHMITSFMTNCFDLMKTDRQSVRKYALYAQHAISTFKEMMIMLNSISNSNFAVEKDYFVQFCQQIFQLEEYRELAGGTLAHLSPAGTTNKMLQDLVVANHYFLHVMEKNVKRGELSKIRKRKGQRRQREKKRREQVKLLTNSINTEKLNELWAEISGELSDTLIGELCLNEEANPINSLLNGDDDQLQAFALLRVQQSLRSKLIADAVGLYRNGRVLWPETGTFGDDQTSIEDEFIALQEIFQADMSKINELYGRALAEAYGDGGKREEAIGGTGDDEEEEEAEGEGHFDDSMEEETNFDVAESDFDFCQFLSSFATPSVVNWYIFGLKSYRTNPQEVNLAILKMFHRIAFEVKSPVRLYQASLFKIFDEVGREINNKYPDKEGRSAHPHFKLFEFGHHLLRRFFSHFKQRGGGETICELLFLKNAREAQEIENGPTD
uniref:EF-hand domain-containing protein n=1 Tax=Globodera rostochiensis TaxID=31243 RepID=A0A914HZ88_GLORO